jgi:hypothetical protein
MSSLPYSLYTNIDVCVHMYVHFMELFVDIRVLQSASMAYKHVTMDAIYECTGQPKPSDSADIVKSLFNDTFEGAYNCE